MASSHCMMNRTNSHDNCELLRSPLYLETDKERLERFPGVQGMAMFVNMYIGTSQNTSAIIRGHDSSYEDADTTHKHQ